MESCDYEQGMHEPIKVVILDTVTGNTATDEQWWIDWWAEGNGACDCNRELLFGHDSMTGHSGICLGCVRYVIVEVNGGKPAEEFNDGYPKALVKQALCTFRRKKPPHPPTSS